MDGLVKALIVLGIILFVFFVAWICFVNKNFPKTIIAICDVVLIGLCIAVFVVGLQIRNQALEGMEKVGGQEVVSDVSDGDAVTSDDVVIGSDAVSGSDVGR